MKKTVKLEQAARAYEALVALSREVMAYRTAHAMMLLKKELQKEAEFLQQEEMKIAKQHAVLDENGNIAWVDSGRFRLKTGEEAQYRKKIQELQDTEISVEAVKTEKPPEMMTMEQAEALDGLLVFEEV